MIFCNQCGSSMAEGLRLCPECGAALPAAAPHVPPPTSPIVERQPAPSSQGVTASLPARSSSTAVIVGGAVVATLLLLGVGFIVGRTWLKDSSTNISRKAEMADDRQSHVLPTKMQPSPPPADTRQPDPRVDTSNTKQAVLAALNSWTAAIRARELNVELSYYAETLDVYYARRNISADFVRELHTRLFSKYATLDMRLSNINIDVSQSGWSATAVFDKTFNFQGEKNYSGAVQSRFDWTKINGVWRITGEQDLKTYYVNRE